VRVVGGEFKGRKLAAPGGRDTRPTSDRARESLFNILSHGAGVDLDGAVVMDLFAGSGALGLEALSRGASHCTFVETARSAISVIQENVSDLGLADRTTIKRVDGSKLPNRIATEPAASLVFLDPPYGKDLAIPALTALKNGGWLAEDVMIVVETGRDENVVFPSPYTLSDERIYGLAKVSFLHS